MLAFIKADMQRIQVFEWESIRVGESHPDRPALSALQFKDLAQWQDAQTQKYFEIGFNKITFTQWVGVIQTKDLSIEVLPKAEDRSPGLDRKQLTQKWSRILLRMVGASMNLDMRQFDDSQLHVRDHTLLDLFYMLLVQEVDTLWHQGLVKKYHSEEKQRSSLKGRLLLSQQLKHNGIHKERFFTQAHEYDIHHPLNEILLESLRFTARNSRSFGVAGLAKNLEHCFPDWPARKFESSDFDSIVLDRKTDGYEKALTLARLVLLQLCPQIETGRNHVVGMFFDMNSLWEEWLRHLIERIFQKQPEASGKWLGTRGKRHSRFWHAPHASKWTETDLLFEWFGTRMVLDAKWKMISDGRPADADLKQMFVYGTIHAASHTALVFPYTNQTAISGTFESSTGPQSMDLLFVPLLEWQSEIEIGFIRTWLESIVQKVATNHV